MVRSIFLHTSRSYDYHDSFLGVVIGNLIKIGTDDKGKPVYEKIRKILISVCPRQLHVLMCSDHEKDGGYKGARDHQGNVRFSLKTIRTYWPNWLRIMDDADMNMCACETCQTMDDLHTAYVAKRRKIIVRAKVALEEMTGNTRAITQRRTRLEKDLNEYEALTFVPVPNKFSLPVHKDGWEACSQYGCGNRQRLEGHEHEFIPYCCQKQDCRACDEIGYTPPVFETTHIQPHELIKFSKFERIVCCTVPGHGGHNIKTFDNHPKLRCMWCEENESDEPGWKQKNKSKVGQRKLRKIFHRSLCAFIGQEGEYTKAMKKMFSHKQGLILSGQQMKSKPRAQYVRGEKVRRC